MRFIRTRICKVGAATIATTQFASAAETKTWLQNIAKMPGAQTNSLACGAVALLISGIEAERQKIVKALE